jgi:hypothetical protein
MGLHLFDFEAVGSPDEAAGGDVIADADWAAQFDEPDPLDFDDDLDTEPSYGDWSDEEPGAELSADDLQQIAEAQEAVAGFLDDASRRFGDFDRDYAAALADQAFNALPPDEQTRENAEALLSAGAEVAAAERFGDAQVAKLVQAEVARWPAGAVEAGEARALAGQLLPGKLAETAGDSVRAASLAIREAVQTLAGYGGQPAPVKIGERVVDRYAPVAAAARAADQFTTRLARQPHDPSKPIRLTDRVMDRYGGGAIASTHHYSNDGKDS